MDKRKAFLLFSEITTRQSRGTYWVSFLQTFFDPGKIMAYSAWIKILVPQIPTVPLLIGAGIFLFSMEFVKYFIGRIDEKMGLWKKQSEYQQKQEHLNPMMIEMRETQKEICKALKIQHHFNDL